MKTLSSLCFALLLGAPLAAQTPVNLPLGAVRAVGSSHSTTPDGIQSWSSTSLLSPSGLWYAEDSYFGSDLPDGFSSVDVILNEPGLWQVWHGYGYGAPQSSSTWSQLDEYLQVGPAANQAPSIAWTSTPGTAAQAQPYTISAHGHDVDGNLSQVNIWKNGQPFALAGGGNGTDGDAGNTTSDSGPQTITFTAQAVDADGAMSPVITQIITISAPANTPPVVTLVAPTAQTVTAGTALTISSHATDPDGNITGHNLDIQRPAGDWNFQGGFATGEPYQGGPVGSGADSTRTASFIFTDVGTYYVRSAANDGSGWVQSATVAITVVAPPPVQYSFVTSAGSGGTVSPGGTYNAGTVVIATATPDATHDFAGWSGDATGTGNPVSLTLDRNKTVQANFSLKVFTLTTSAGTGGSVTPGGSYTYGTSVTVSATPDSTHDFIDWSGDAGGSVNPVSLVIDRNKNVQANFSPKILYSFVTSAGSGGAVSAGGTYNAGTVVTATATPDSTHDFAGWSGDATGIGNPVSLTLDRNKTVQANFSLKVFTLTTSAGTGGSVTPGGSYPYGTNITVSATPDSSHDFTGWSGDAGGAVNPVSLVIDRSKTVQANFSPKILYSVVTSASAGGTVSPGGTYNAGTVVTATATPDSTHDFAGWSGDATGTGNPVSLTLDRNKTVQANFTLKLFALTTSATAGGGVTPGGSYPYGTSLTISAVSDATHRFIGWAGDVSGSTPSILVTLTGPLNVQAVFTTKTGQTITFVSPGNLPVGSSSVTLGGSASSGLPVTYVVLSGPATITGNQLQLTGPGSVTVQVSQPGDATFLPAANVIQTFNAVAAAFVKYRPTSRTLFQTNATTGTTPFVLEKP